MQQDDKKSSEDLRKEATDDRKGADDLEEAAVETKEGEDAQKAARDAKVEREPDAD